MKKRKIDLIIIAVIIFMAAVSFIVIHIFYKDTGKTVQIFVKNRLVKELPLDKDITYNIEDGDYFNTLTIKDSRVYMTDANCPDKLCVKQKEIKENGENIICLPHKVIVKVVSDDIHSDKKIISGERK